MNKQIEGLAILRQAIDYYGCEMQLNVAVEEFAELTKEICKHKRGADNTPQIIEEMADCYIMLQQIKMMFAVYDGVVDDEINRKIERLGQRMEKEKRQRTNRLCGCAEPFGIMEEINKKMMGEER